MIDLADAACRKTREGAERSQEHSWEQSGAHLPTRGSISHHTPYPDVPIIAVKNEKQMKKTHFALTALSFPGNMLKASKASSQEME